MILGRFFLLRTKSKMTSQETICINPLPKRRPTFTIPKNDVYIWESPWVFCTQKMFIFANLCMTDGISFTSNHRNVSHFFFIFSNIKEAIFPHLGLKIMQNFSVSPQARQSEQLLRLFVQALEFTDNPFSYPL